MDSDTHHPQTLRVAYDLGYEEHNDSASETIVFLHAMGTSRREWDLVLAHIPSTYHIIVIDMPGHSSSMSAKPLTVPAQADRVAQLIKSCAHDEKAHVSGVSMGGFVAMDLARRYPANVTSVFSSGAAPYEGARLWFSQRASWLAIFNDFTHYITPAWFSSWKTDKIHAVQGLQISDALKRDMKINDSPALMAEVLKSVGNEVTMERMMEVKVRTLTVAAGRMDAVNATRNQGAMLREGCRESKAVVVRNAWHMWQLQLPELFAASLLAWVGEKMLPPEMEVLEVF